jgi:hypothetical protein
MALTKSTEIGQVEVVGQFKAIQVRTDTVIKEDDKEISLTHHRHAFNCGVLDESDNFVETNISSQDASVQAICNAVWTQAVKDDYKAYLIANKIG